MNEEKIKQILEREIKRHTDEIERHRELFEKRRSKKEKNKSIKHFHKRFQTIKIADKLGYRVCPCCGRLE